MAGGYCGALLSLRLGRSSCGLPSDRRMHQAAHRRTSWWVTWTGTFHFITALIRYFVFVTAANEYRMVKLTLEDHQVRGVAVLQFTKLYTQDPLSLPRMGPG